MRAAAQSVKIAENLGTRAVHGLKTIIRHARLRFVIPPPLRLVQDDLEVPNVRPFFIDFLFRAKFLSIAVADVEPCSVQNPT